MDSDGLRQVADNGVGDKGYPRYFFVVFFHKRQVGMQGLEGVPAGEGLGVNDQAIEVAGFLDIRVNDLRGRLEVTLAQRAVGCQCRDAVLLVQRNVQLDLVPPVSVPVMSGGTLAVSSDYGHDKDDIAKAGQCQSRAPDRHPVVPAAHAGEYKTDTDDQAEQRQ